MKTIPVSQVRANIRDLLDQALAGHPTVIERNGKAVAVIVPATFFNLGCDIPADEHQTAPA
jgi:prevent-host-death family protein